jgi:hypothetical protein
MANLFPGEVADRAFLGSFLDYRIRVGKAVLRVQAPKECKFEPGASLFVRLAPGRVRYFKDENPKA